MTDHLTAILVAYGFTAACVVGELIAIARRRRGALERALREADLDEERPA